MQSQDERLEAAIASAQISSSWRDRLKSLAQAREVLFHGRMPLQRVQQALPTLVEVFATDTNVNVRARAVEVLAALATTFLGAGGSRGGGAGGHGAAVALTLSALYTVFEALVAVQAKEESADSDDTSTTSISKCELSIFRTASRLYVDTLAFCSSALRSAYERGGGGSDQLRRSVARTWEKVAALREA